ncbi:MAG: helix-turn-helix domain-containing protein [Gammaproteobacteria bacterium]|nr:helix-turn-helix domain-containing protein [Gammaproteobacteria bacterium]MYK82091.1 helix-turn-helix domain-containing protein [Gammaproteobacteria bacterium]
MAHYVGALETSLKLQAELGRRLAKLRLARNVTQQMLAREAGIGLRTVRRLEAGEPTSLDTFLRVVIALDLGEGLLTAVPSYDIRPIQRVENRGRERRRARPKTASQQSGPWTWGEETRD